MDGEIRQAFSNLETLVKNNFTNLSEQIKRSDERIVALQDSDLNMC